LLLENRRRHAPARLAAHRPPPHATHDESFKAIGDSVRLMDDGRLLADGAGK
jgi:hypothetical protein